MKEQLAESMKSTRVGRKVGIFWPFDNPIVFLIANRWDFLLDKYLCRLTSDMKVVGLCPKKQNIPIGLWVFGPLWSVAYRS